MRKTKKDEEVILEKIRELPSDKKREVIDFVEFLESREKEKKWLEFDAWALNLAKKKRFAHLTEREVSQIVSDYRESEQ